MKLQAEPSSISCVVTVSDYADFLNHTAVTDPNFLYDQKMATDPNTGCITRTGMSGSFHYEVIAGRENDPVVFVDENDAEAYATSRKNEIKLLSSISCNKAGFEVFSSSSPTLSLAVTSTSTSKLNSCFEEAIIVAGIVGLAAFGSGLVTLDEFRQAAAHPDNAGAERLVTGDNGRIIRSDQAGFKVSSDDDKIIIEALIQELQSDGHSPESAQAFVRAQIDNFGFLGETSSPLSTTRLQRIIAGADNARDEREKSGVASKRDALSQKVKSQRVLTLQDFRDVANDPAYEKTQRLMLQGSEKNVKIAPCNDYINKKLDNEKITEALYAALKIQYGSEYAQKIIKKGLHSTLKNIVWDGSKPSLTVERLKSILKEADKDKEASQIPLCNGKTVIQRVVNQGRQEDDLDKYYAVAEDLYREVQATWKEYRATLKKMTINEEVIKWLRDLLTEEEERLAKEEDTTKTGILLNLCDEALRRSSSQLEKISFYDDSIKQVFDKIIPNAFGNNETRLVNFLKNDLGISNSDVNAKGALEFCFCMLKWALKKYNEVPRDSMQDQLEKEINKFNKDKEAVDGLFSKALELDRKAKSQDDALKAADYESTKRDAIIIKLPINNNIEEWSQWAQQHVELDDTIKHYRNEWTHHIANTGISAKELSEAVAVAWSERIKASEQLIETIKANKEEELKSLDESCKKTQEEAKTAIAKAKSAQQDFERAIKDDIESQERLEELKKKHFSLTVQSTEVPLDKIDEEKKIQQEINSLGLLLKENRLDDNKTKVEKMKQDANSAQAISEEKARNYKEIEERYDRAIVRANHRKAIDSQVWQEIWRENYLKELANAALAKAMDLCAKATTDSNWSEQADAVADAFKDAASHARNVLNISNTEDQKNVWDQKTKQAEANALFAVTPQVIEAKTAFAKAKDACGDSASKPKTLDAGYVAASYYINAAAALRGAADKIAAATASEVASVIDAYCANATVAARISLNAVPIKRGTAIYSAAARNDAASNVRSVNTRATNAVNAARAFGDHIWVVEMLWAAESAQEAASFVRNIAKSKQGAKDSKPWRGAWLAPSRSRVKSGTTL